MKKIFLGMILGVFLVGTVALAETINGIEFLGIAGGAQTDSTGYGAVEYDYLISQNEITYAQFALSGVGNGNEDYWVTNGVPVGAPVVNVSWYEAAQYCNWLSSGDATVGVYMIDGNGMVTGINRAYRNGEGLAFVLPTENEWYRAAYFDGDGFTTYAIGTNGLAGVNYDNAIGTAWAVGSGGAAENNGTFDMMGNAFEMLESAYVGEINFADTNQFMMNLGGAYDRDASFLASDTRAVNTIDNTSYRYDEADLLTFRPAVIPEPGTMSLMGLSTVGLFFTRTIRRRKRLGQTLLPVRREHLCDRFDAEREWNAGIDVEHDDYLILVINGFKDGFLKLWSDVVRVNQSIDKAFWNRMVVVHERRVARCTRLRKTLRKKALDGFDAFLVRIMK